MSSSFVNKQIDAGTYGQAEFDGVHRMVEGPGELMLPQSLHHHVLHVLQLVGFPAEATEGKPNPLSHFTQHTDTL